MDSDIAMEKKIQELGLTAPRVTLEQVLHVIANEAFIHPIDTTLTLCILTLKNGTVLVGKSACVSPENFKVEVGTKLAHDDAVRQIWALEGYALAERLRPDPEKIARVCHEVNRAYCQALGDVSQPAWEDAPEWQRTSAINGVEMHLNNPGVGASASHESWMKEKLENGWKYGPVKDPEKKEHHCLVPFDQLPPEQQAKDFIFRSIVYALVA